MKKIYVLSCFLGSLVAAPVLDVIPHKYKITEKEFALMQELFSPEVFVETGTYHGWTTATAAKLFKEVKTIELSPELYLDTKTRLEKSHDNIEFFLGNSAFVLPEIARNLTGCALFYLDAHFCFGGSAKDFNDPPLMGELEGVLLNAPKDAVILIDDLRVFAGNQRLPFDAYNYYPTVIDIAKRVKELSPESRLYILGDEAIIFNPIYHPIRVSHLVEYITKSLVNNDIDVIAEGDLGLIGGLNEEDIAHLNELYELYGDMDRSLISFWLGLAHIRSNPSRALEYFVEAESRGFYHPRIYKYMKVLRAGGQL